MNIGVDFDNVINNFNDVVRPFIKRKIGFDSDPNSYELFPKEYTDKKKQEFFVEHLKYMHEHTQPQHNVVEILDYLLENHKIYIITARTYQWGKDTKSWLDQHNINYTELLFHCGNKVEVSKYLDLDIVVDDSPYNLLAMAQEKIPTITFDYPYNKNIYSTEYRSDNWVDIYSFLTSR